MYKKITRKNRWSKRNFVIMGGISQTINHSGYVSSKESPRHNGWSNVYSLVSLSRRIHTSVSPRKRHNSCQLLICRCWVTMLSCWNVGLLCLDTAVFKWLSKVIVQLRMLRFLIGLKISLQYWDGEMWRKVRRPNTWFIGLMYTTYITDLDLYSETSTLGRLPYYTRQTSQHQAT